MYIKISVNNKIATIEDNVLIINGNSDYVIKFDFDAEWDAYQTKTARFVTARGYTDVVFSGDEVALPVITDAISVRVGVYAGNLHTTTPAVIFCRRCITDGSGSPADPAPDVYAQIMERLNNLDGATPATADKLGVVKIGDNLKITEDGVLSVDTADALDTTLTQSGKAADAKAVGDALRSLSEEKVNPVAKTADMTHPVGVDGNGLLWTAPTSNDSGDSGSTKPGGIWVILGDSISVSTGYTSKFYYDFIKDDLGFTPEILAVGGQGYRSGEGSRFYETQCPNIPNDYAVLTIMGGTNDNVKTMVDGSVVDITGKVTDTTADTFYGALYLTLIDGIQAKHPEKPLGVIIPIPRNNSDYYRARCDEVCEALVTFCEYYNIPYLDLHKQGGVNPYVESIAAVQYASDKIHLNDLGHEIIARRIKSFVSMLASVGSGESEGSSVTYTVTNSLTNVANNNGASSVAENAAYTATLTADSGYILDSVTVTMGGVDITSTAYNNGVVSISAVTGNVVITATATVSETPVVTYTITANLTNVTSDNSATSVQEGNGYTATLTVADGYTLGSVVVTMGGTDVTADAYADGVITIESVTGDVVITAEAVESAPAENIFDKNTMVLSGLINPNGTLSSSTTKQYVKIPVTGGTKYNVYHGGNFANWFGVAQWDESDTVIVWLANGNTASNDFRQPDQTVIAAPGIVHDSGETAFTFTAEPTAKYLVFNTNDALTEVLEVTATA